MIDKRILMNELSEWKGTKWIPGQACKGVGVDCVNFVVAVYKNIGSVPKSFEMPVYYQDWSLHNSNSILVEYLTNYTDKISLSDIDIGDLITYRYGRCASHIAIYIGNGEIIHSRFGKGVIISKVSEFSKMFESAWRIK